MLCVTNLWNVSSSAGPSWQTCTTSARRMEWASGEWRKLKTCRIWSKIESPTCRYLQTELLLSQLASFYLSHSMTQTHTRRHIHSHIDEHEEQVCLPHTYKCADLFSGCLSYLLVSFAPSIAVSISFHEEQVRGLLADCFSSWIWQTGFLLLVSGLVTHIHPYASKCRQTCKLAEWQILPEAHMQKIQASQHETDRHTRIY